MVTATKIPTQEYLELERNAEFKSEYIDGTIVPMPGATRAHNIIETNIVRDLSFQVKGRECEVYGGNMKVRVSAGYRYPDVIVVCDEPLFEDIETDVLLNPTVIFEVLSKSTESYDRGDKFAEYRQRESLQAYVLVSQLMPRIEIYRRHGQDWIFSEMSGLNKVLRLETIGCELKLTEVYGKVNLTKKE
ncbi:MAG: Uma2 family endonuclease [Trueperaceae bacterium]